MGFWGPIRAKVMALDRHSGPIAIRTGHVQRDYRDGVQTALCFAMYVVLLNWRGPLRRRSRSSYFWILKRTVRQAPDRFHDGID